MGHTTKISDMGLSAKSLLRKGCLNILLGLLLIYFQRDLTEWIVALFIAYLTLQGLWDLLLRLFRKQKSQDPLWLALLKTSLLLIFGGSSLAIQAPIYILVTFIAIYQLFIAFISGVTYWIYRMNRLRPRWGYLWDATWQFAIGFSAMMNPAYRANRQIFFFGCYLVMWGASNLRDGFYFDKNSTREDLRRNVRISLPIVIAAILPANTLAKLNDYLQGNESATLDSAYNEYKLIEGPIDLEVFVHVNESGFGAVGHVDLAYKGQVIAYGNYDVWSERLAGMVGDGVYFKVDREKYIAFCKKESNKTLLGYGIRLSDKQQAAIEKEIADLESLIEPWQPSNRDCMKQGENLGPMYAYKLQQETGAQLYKFKSSKFKTYFVLSTNCVLLADTILGKAGTDILSTKGFIAPGTYQDYLNREFEKPNGIVVTKQAYQ